MSIIDGHLRAPDPGDLPAMRAVRPPGRLAVSLRKVGRELRARGPTATAQMAARFIRVRVLSLLPSRRAIRRRWAEREAAFDRARGVDTAGTISIAALEGIVSDSSDDAKRYEATDPEPLAAALAGLGIDYPAYTFLDLGCGKGRVLLQAAEWPFRRVVGVEFAPSLHATAVRNIAADRGPRRCPDVAAVLGDAAEFPIPAGPLVVFMFNPFGESVMARVLENLARSHRDEPRDMRILYWNPELAALLDRLGFVRVTATSDFSAYRPPPLPDDRVPGPTRGAMPDRKG